MSPLIVILALLAGAVKALSPQFIQCQIQKPASGSPLTGCPAGTIFVSQNASDPHTQFTSVQAAILSLPNTGPATILIAAGAYQEAINISRTGPLTLLGQLPASALSTQSKPFANASSANMNLVQIWNNQFVHTGQDDASSAPLFGNTDFRAYNIDFQNRAADFAISQALVTDISYANASFYACSFASFQDTWYTGRNASTYVVDSVIFGQTDYLFGFGTAWFQNVILANRACGGGLVAWKGTNLTDAPGNRYGAYIASSQIIRSPDANATTNTNGLCFLGRPWNDLATTVFLQTFMDASVAPAGFKPFSSGGTIMNTTFYAEFNSTGPGGSTANRVPIEHRLTAEQAKPFTIDGVFLGHPKWIDFGYLF
ncbi:pectin lyase-like protein [Mycena rebaudengoi]|nr:pectin lyase-like protein [Mycena rebaudengoi]